MDSDLKFNNKKKCQNLLAAINTDMADVFAGLGYTVVNGEVIGKNAATGLDMPDAQRTTKWDEVDENDDGNFYITNPETSQALAAIMSKYDGNVHGFVKGKRPKADEP